MDGVDGIGEGWGVWGEVGVGVLGGGVCVGITGGWGGVVGR